MWISALLDLHVIFQHFRSAKEKMIVNSEHEVFQLIDDNLIVLDSQVHLSVRWVDYLGDEVIQVITNIALHMIRERRGGPEINY